MENHEIELITDEMMKNEQQEIVEMCSPGWCGPVDGYLLHDNDSDD